MGFVLKISFSLNTSTLAHVAPTAAAVTSGAGVDPGWRLSARSTGRAGHTSGLGSWGPLSHSPRPRRPRERQAWGPAALGWECRASLRYIKKPGSQAQEGIGPSTLELRCGAGRATLWEAGGQSRVAAAVSGPAECHCGDSGTAGAGPGSAFTTHPCSTGGPASRPAPGLGVMVPTAGHWGVTEGPSS